MPKFLAVNYLTEALKKRHALLERMLLLPPQHLEHVDSYIHKGDVPDCSYACPWKSVEFDWVIGRLGDEHTQAAGSGVTTCSDVTTCSEVFSGLNVDESCLEFYDVNNGMGGNTDSTVIDDSMSVEIELAMEKAGIGMYYAKEEEFNLELLDTWNNIIIEDGGDWVLEEVEETKPLTALLDSTPTVDQLCSRLKPKMIQDPLLGDHLDHSYIFRSDRHMISDDDMDTTSALTDKEQFKKEDLLPVDQEDEETDKKHLIGLLEEPDLSDSNDDNVMDLPELEPSPCSDHEAVLSVDMGSIMDSGDHTLLPMSPPTPLLDFIHLNDQLVSCGSDSDSGVNLLESPCVVRGTWTTPTIDALHQLHRLEPLPLSPDWNRTTSIMSSKDKERVVEEMWQKEKMFDELLALILQVPDVCNELTLESVYVTTVKLICPSHLPLDTNMELEMGWDPLCGLHDRIFATQLSLNHLLHHPTVSTLQWTNYKESFCVEPSLLNIIDDDNDCQLSITSLPDGGVALQHYDLPQPLKVSSFNPSAVNGSSSSIKDGLIPAKATSRQLDTSINLCSSLDEFISMRTAVKSSSLKPLSQLCQEHNSDDNDMEWDNGDDGIIKDCQMIEVTLSEHYGSVMEHIENSVAHILSCIHHIVPSFSYSQSNLTLNQVRELLKQTTPPPDCDIDNDNAQPQKLHRLAIQLFIYCCVVDLLLHCSAAVSMSELMDLLDQYSDVVRRDMEPLREQMARLLVKLRERGGLHPKMEELRNIMCRWVTRCDGNRKKVIVVLEREFSSLSGEILDIFQSIRGLSACVHSWTSSVDGMGKHQDALEDRFRYYDCLFVPKSSLTGQFPWHRVNLLVEYEHTGNSITLYPSVEHVTLKCNSDIFPGLAGSPIDPSNQDGHEVISRNDQYLFIGSEILTQNAELLRLLETKQNIAILERDYNSIAMKGRHSISTADVIVDAKTGIILRPVGQLEEASGLKEIVNITYTLSVQYEFLWIVLYSTPMDSYPYAGHVSGNISRLHASLAHFDASKDEFQARVIYVNSYTEVADMIRRIGELAHQSDTVWGCSAWIDRSWINTDTISKHEVFLLSFPCVNAFSAQVMLAVCSLRDLLTMSSQELFSTIPWIPAKVLKMFHLMTNLCKYSDTSITKGSDDTEHVTITTGLTTHHSNNDEFVCDSLSETECSPFNNEHTFYSSKLIQGGSNEGKSLLFTAIPNSHDSNVICESSQLNGSQSVFRSTYRKKTPLKALDLDSTDVNHFLQANDRSVVRNITASGMISGYASRDKVLRYNFNQLDVPADHHNTWIPK